MGIKDLLTSYPALQEFGLAAQAIKPAMTDATISRKDKRITLNTLVEGLSEKCFHNSTVAKQIMIIINMREDVCKEYINTEAQVKGILKWLPRMEYHKQVLTKEVEKYRKLYGLGV